MRVLIVTAVRAEADALPPIDEATVVVGGVGRTNAACATTRALLEQGPMDLVLSAGVAGALPGGNLDVGDAVVASACVYAEEGLMTPAGFSDLASIGLSLGDFPGNRVPVDGEALEILGAAFPVGPIATVATCSGTDEAALAVARRTGGIAEAMEGAAVVHAARRLGVRGLELRVISNRTGPRPLQRWDLPRALETLGRSVDRAVRLLRSSGSYG